MLKYYIERRIKQTDFENIINCENKNISPKNHNHLKKCTCSTIDIERSFYMLENIIRSDRNFLTGNVESYFISYYNSRTIEEVYDDKEEIN